MTLEYAILCHWGSLSWATRVCYLVPLGYAILWKHMFLPSSGRTYTSLQLSVDQNEQREYVVKSTAFDKDKLCSVAAFQGHSSRCASLLSYQEPDQHWGQIDATMRSCWGHAGVKLVFRHLQPCCASPLPTQDKVAGTVCRQCQAVLCSFMNQSQCSSYSLYSVVLYSVVQCHTV